GERRMQYTARRLGRAAAALAAVPAHLRRGAGLAPPPPHLLSPFCAVRSDALLPLALQRFELLHRVDAAPFGALDRHVDLAALRREAPAAAACLQDAVAAALRDPAVGPTEAYLVLRKRA
ncbi:MAG: hypothetical protein SF182_22470, partial [Deltaproteobacteria bacterium]|nr:hypothetical protein [Deltaproteobacteria bacterium]